MRDDAQPSNDVNLLEVRDLVVEYPIRGFKRLPFRALNGVSISIERGKTLGLVGESGSGKTTLGRALFGMAPVAGGSIMFDGLDATRLNRRQRRAASDRIQMVFQDPYSSLNPSMTIGDTLTEPLRVRGVERPQARALEVLDQVGMPSDSIRRLPSSFSGGQRQRIAIARALMMSPRLIVCDEPVSALDLSTQAKVLDLLLQIQRNTGVAYLFVSHDLDVVRYVSHDVAVMFRGDIVEQGPANRVTNTPDHPYTRNLLLASPLPDPDLQANRREQRRQMRSATAAEDEASTVRL